MIITVQNKQKDLSISIPAIKKIIPFLLQELGFVTDELNVYFLTKEKMGQVHADFFSDPSPTDCMSFPLDLPVREKSDQEHHILGEIFVCPQVAVEYAIKKNLDPYQETTLYLVHGLLHLLGYDDLDPISRKEMRKMESFCMKKIQSFSLARNVKEKYCLGTPKE